MIGTFVNTATVLAGGLLGTLFGSRLSERIRETVMTGMSLVVIALGIKMTLETSNILIVLGSITIGSILGEVLHLQRQLDSVGLWLEAVTSRFSFLSRGNFSQGFVTASLVFCVGPMTIMGSIQDGLSGDSSLLLVKSVLDGFAAIAFASVMGMGVTFSAITVLLVQGALTLGSSLFSNVLTQGMVSELTATGGVIMLGIAIHMLDLKKIRLANFLPALAIAPLIVWISGIIQG
ncbi:MAG: DUF554 domain-containing protein [Candidatus Sabulitectum sp.]|nr:DUF554 domain-containing protein [Candidatus Sabulitectum sp.]